MVTEPRRRDKDERGRFVRGNRAAIKSGCGSFLIRGKLPPVRGVRKIKREMDRIKTELEASVSPPNVKQQILVNQIIKAHGFCLLFEYYCKRLGLFDIDKTKKGQLDFQGGFSTYLSLMNSQRHALRELSNTQDKDNEKPETIIDILRKEKEEKNGNQNNSRP